MPASDAFFRAYVAAALWSTNDNADDSGGEPLDSNYGSEDIDPDTLTKMRAECDAFCNANASDLIEFAAALPHREEWTTDEQAGHDYWLTRNGHGVGFWDRNVGDVGDRLSAACKHTEVDLYVGDDGKIYQANKIVKGRAVGNLWGVGTYVDGQRTCYAIRPQESEEIARAFVREAHAPKEAGSETREHRDERIAGA